MCAYIMRITFQRMRSFDKKKINRKRNNDKKVSKAQHDGKAALNPTKRKRVKRELVREILRGSDEEIR